MINLSETTSETMSMAGQINSIELPLFNINKISHTFGKKVTQGDCGTIFRVKDSQPPRLYKIISLKDFKNGDEIRISKIAAEIGVAPAFHQAFLLQQRESQFVVIEMDDAGKTMGDWMEDLVEKKAVEEKRPLSEKERLIQEMWKKIQAEHGDDGIVVTAIKKRERLDLKDAIKKMYETPEEFYYQLFSIILKLAENNISYRDSHVGNIILKLAENNISYRDSHVGNIMPHHGTEIGMQIIDFDSAELHENPKSALRESMSSAYNVLHYTKYIELPELSAKSEELARDFFSHMKKTE